MGKPVVHWELWSKNPEKIADFYKSVFDWKIQHRPEMNYHVVDKMQVPGMGAFSLFEDLDGRVLGMWKQNK